MPTNNAWNSQNPAQVAKGGTGRATIDAYTVVCGGTTTTNPLQNVVGLGNNGQILTSNGPAALPSWEDSGVAPGSLCSFLSYLNVTTGNTGGNHPLYVIFDSEYYDLHNNYNTATGIFTAPVNGIFQFNVTIYFTTADASNNEFTVALVTTARTYWINEIKDVVFLTLPGNRCAVGTINVSMNAGETARVLVNAYFFPSGGNQNVALRGVDGFGTWCWFGGYLVTQV